MPPDSRDVDVVAVRPAVGLAVEAIAIDVVVARTVTVGVDAVVPGLRRARTDAGVSVVAVAATEEATAESTAA